LSPGRKGGPLDARDEPLSHALRMAAGAESSWASSSLRSSCLVLRSRSKYQAATPRERRQWSPRSSPYTGRRGRKAAQRQAQADKERCQHVPQERQVRKALARLRQPQTSYRPDGSPLLPRNRFRFLPIPGKAHGLLGGYRQGRNSLFASRLPGPPVRTKCHERASSSGMQPFSQRELDGDTSAWLSRSRQAKTRDGRCQRAGRAGSTREIEQQPFSFRTAKSFPAQRS